MSHRRAKRIRAVLRAKSVEPTQKLYAPVRNNARGVNTGELDEHGKSLVRRFEYTGTIRLAQQCGRAAYQHVKRGLA
jgi:hypothetical protein